MKKNWIFLTLLLFLSGCKVGPNYKTPSTPVPMCYTEERTEQTFAPSDADLVNWWTLFQDPALDQLLKESIKGSFDLKIAVERVFQFRAQYWVQFTQLLPDFISDAQATRFRRSLAFTSTNPTPVSPLQNFFQIGFDAIWEIDLFGRLRRAAAAAYDIYQATEEDARDVKITVLSEVAKTYMAIRSYQVKTEIARDVVRLDEELFALSKERFQCGLTNEQEMETARALLETDTASLLALETLLRQTIYSLGVLVGKPPECLLEQFNTVEPIPLATGKIPTGVPADLLRRRPDIRSAERQLAAQTEQIGVAVADLFPTINLVGSSSSFAANPLQGANIGYSSDTFRQLFTSQSRIWGIGSLVTWPIFGFGKRVSAIEAQVFLQHQAYFAYQKTVVAALQEVEQALVAYFNEETKQTHLLKELEANERIMDLNLDLYESGLANFTPFLQSREIWLSSFNALTDSEQALAEDLIAVYKALGGEWSCY